MNLNLDRNLVFFDIESTGLNVIRDRIIQLAMIRYHKNGSPPVEKSYLINPGIPISAEAMAVHGITPQDVANKPIFQILAKEIFDFIGDADLAGYNSNRFDIPVLMEEFARVGLDFNLDNRRTIDVQRIFYRMEPRTLSAAYQFYCNKNIENAHDAMEDVRATIEVLDGQLKKYNG
ncbi:MAG TPA: 3'-5' exonuclease, partial [Cyclobacteriaceae bacterium]